MKQLIVRNFWLKILALFLAAIVWMYIVGELNKGAPDEKALFERIMPARVMAKEVPIKISLIGKPVPGYTIATEEISVTPSKCAVFASPRILKNIDYFATEEIDISEFTKSVVKEIKLKRVKPGIIFENDFLVRVVIPIKKIKQETEVKN
jgi:YbbR domain-containing protein